MSKLTYLDYNATTPLHPALLSFTQETLTKFGNPSSVHGLGRESKKVISQARAMVASFLNCEELELVFTSGGSEGNNTALKGASRFFSPERREIICTKIEHPSVLKTIEFLEKQGFKIKYLNVGKNGSLDLEHLDELLNPQTAMVTVQLVNNETGNIFPIKEIAKRAHNAGAVMHSDMVQGLGKIPIDLKDLNVDFATFAGHKFYSLKGTGILFIKKGARLAPLIAGGGQERSRRAGTENALAIGTLGEAIRVLGPDLGRTTHSLEKLRDHFETRVKNEIRNCRINGGESLRVGNTSNITFENIDGETLLINLDTRGFAVSSGAACSSGSQEPSPVLRGMGFTAEEASQSIRVSLGWLTTEDEMNRFFDNLKGSVIQMRDAKRAMAAEDDVENDVGEANP